MELRCKCEGCPNFGGNADDCFYVATLDNNHKKQEFKVGDQVEIRYKMPSFPCKEGNMAPEDKCECGAEAVHGEKTTHAVYCPKAKK